MTVSVEIPSTMRRFVDGRTRLAVDNAINVEAALQRVASDYPGLAGRLFTPEGQIRSFVGVFVNDRDVRQLQRLQTPLRSGDVVSLVPAIAGG